MPQKKGGRGKTGKKPVSLSEDSLDEIQALKAIYGDVFETIEDDEEGTVQVGRREGVTGFGWIVPSLARPLSSAVSSLGRMVRFRICTLIDCTLISWTRLDP